MNIHYTDRNFNAAFCMNVCKVKYMSTVSHPDALSGVILYDRMYHVVLFVSEHIYIYIISE